MARILIVDDDADIIEAVRLFLEREGHAVTSARNRQEGMQLAVEKPVDLLILDIMMEEPDDGIAMAQDLRRTGFSQPILMMSSISKVTGLSYTRDDAVTPVNDFVEKPVEPGQLIKKVAELLAGTGGGGPC